METLSSCEIAHFCAACGVTFESMACVSNCGPFTFEATLLLDGATPKYPEDVHTHTQTRTRTLPHTHTHKCTRTCIHTHTNMDAQTQMDTHLRTQVYTRVSQHDDVRANRSLKKQYECAKTKIRELLTVETTRN